MTRNVDIDFYVEAETGAVTIRGEPQPLFWLPLPVDPNMGYMDLKSAVKAELRSLFDICLDATGTLEVPS